MKYYLQNNQISIVVDTLGAYIDTLKHKGKTVLFNKLKLEVNGRIIDRGGSHICFPQFSTGGKFDLEKHGFGRVSEWDVIDNSESHIVLELVAKNEKYKDLVTKIFYTLDGNKIVMKLLLTNKSDKGIEVAPAFHPYFEIGDERTIILDGEVIDLDDEDLKETLYKDDVKSLITKDYTVEFEQRNLSVYALWTDRLSSYFCVEPTHSSISFERGEGYATISPGATKEFVFEMKIK